jgi:hypothetical protein
LCPRSRFQRILHSSGVSLTGLPVRFYRAQDAMRPHSATAQLQISSPSCRKHPSLNRFRSFFASPCFHSLDSAVVPPWAPPPDKHVTGVGFPMASWAPKLVVSPRYLEPFMKSLGYLYGLRTWQTWPLSVAAGDISS